MESLGVSLERILGTVRQTERSDVNCCDSNAWGAVMGWEMPFNSLSRDSFRLSFRSPLTVGSWLTAVVTVLGVGYAVMMPKPSQSLTVHPSQATSQRQKVSILELAKSGNCQTLVTDPNPPLNIRSSPVSAKDNVVGNLRNGTIVTVVNENEGWLQIAQPLRGWVYENLTVTTCHTDRNKVSANPVTTSHTGLSSLATEESTKSITMSGEAMVNAAQNKFHAGDLQGAIEQLRQVSAEDNSHSQAASLLKTMPEQWESAVKTYHKAETAIKIRHPQDVLALVSEMPDIRHWRAKMTPLVKQAIAQQNGAF
jgi:Bacterial SH3 domain